jgi:hypothetical protein
MSVDNFVEKAMVIAAKAHQTLGLLDCPLFCQRRET